MEKLTARLSLIFWIWVGILILLGSYTPDFFDAALSMLSQHYTSQGLVPYRDFGMVYPPGIFLLFGRILGADSQLLTQIYAMMIYAPLTYAAFRTLQQLINPRKLTGYEMAILAGAHAVTLYSLSFKGVIPLVLFTYIFLQMSLVFKNYNITNFAWLAALMGIAVWVRWEWSMGLATLFLLATLCKGRNRKAAVAVTGGLGVGLISLFLYLKSIGVWEIAYDYLVKMPIWLTRTYRDLPLPNLLNWKSPDLMFYFLGVAILILLLQLSKTWRFQSSSIMTLGYIGMFVPYALGRSDFGHFQPLWLATILGLILLKPKLQSSNAVLIVLYLSFIPIVPWFGKVSNLLIPKPGYAQQYVNEGIRECRELTGTLKASSIWVGRTEYDRYLFNIVPLYLIRPELPPATRFIAEEPGIQSNCEYGGEVRRQLQLAPRPLLTYLELDEHAPENEATETMKSCGQIEEFVNWMTFEKIGVCTAYGHPYEIRVYK